MEALGFIPREFDAFTAVLESRFQEARIMSRRSKYHKSLPADLGDTVIRACNIFIYLPALNPDNALRDALITGLIAFRWKHPKNYQEKHSRDSTPLVFRGERSH